MRYLLANLRNSSPFSSKLTQVSCPSCDTIAYQSLEALNLQEICSVAPRICSYCGSSLVLEDLEHPVEVRALGNNLQNFEKILKRQELRHVVKKRNNFIVLDVLPKSWSLLSNLKDQKQILDDSREGIYFSEINPSSYEGFKKYLFLDLDKTCCDPSTNRISMLLMKFLLKLEQKKIVKIIFNSGRPISALKFLSRDLGFKGTVIGNNGLAVGYSAKDSQGHTYPMIQRAPGKDSLMSVVNILKMKHNIKLTPLLEFNEEADILINQAEIASIETLQKIIDYDPQIQRATAHLGGVTLTDSLTGIIHLHGKNYSKGSAIKAYLQATGIDKQDTLFAGNGFNDIPARPYVGYVLAVANAEEDFKKVADNVSTESDFMGTIEGLSKYLSERKLITKLEATKILDQVANDISRELSLITKALNQSN